MGCWPQDDWLPAGHPPAQRNARHGNTCRVKWLVVIRWLLVPAASGIVRPASREPSSSGDLVQNLFIGYFVAHARHPRNSEWRHNRVHDSLRSQIASFTSVSLIHRMNSRHLSGLLHCRRTQICRLDDVIYNAVSPEQRQSNALHQSRCLAADG